MLVGDAIVRHLVAEVAIIILSRLVSNLWVNKFFWSTLFLLSSNFCGLLFLLVNIADLQISKSPIGPTKKSGEAL